jgi:hypothetical protein
VRLDPDIIRREIDALMVSVPELADDEQLRHDMVQAETSAFDLLSVLVKRAGECEAQRTGLASYVKELHERDARLERRYHGLRTAMRKIMECANLTKAQLASATLSIAAGKPKVIITDDAALPDVLCRFKREPDKTKIRDFLSTGQVVQGAVLSNAEPVLTLRVK